jgi:hypothetical protein
MMINHIALMRNENGEKTYPTPLKPGSLDIQYAYQEQT